MANIAQRKFIAGSIVEPMDVVGKDDRVALFMDAANMEASFDDANMRVDYVKLRDLFLGLGKHYGTFYFAPDWGEAPQRRFFDMLSYSNYTIVRKAVHDIVTDNGVKSKANVDVEITMHMLNTQHLWDVAFLFSGDNDFEALVSHLRLKGKRVYVVSTRNYLGRELALSADKPVFDVAEFADQLRRE